MTDKEILFTYRLNQAQETVCDANILIKGNASPRSIINRAYYSMFYAVLALFIKYNINLKTSKHIGIISAFNKEFVNTGKIDKHYFKILNQMFRVRQKSDYKELVEFSFGDAVNFVTIADEFINCIKQELVLPPMTDKEEFI